MSRREDLRSRASRAANRAPAAEQVQLPQQPAPVALTADPPPPSLPPTRPARAAASTPRTKPVRMTIDLSPLAHERLRTRRNTLRGELGMVADLPGAVVVRALLAELDADPNLAAAVRDRIADDPTGYGKQ